MSAFDSRFDDERVMRGKKPTNTKGKAPGGVNADEKPRPRGKQITDDDDTTRVARVSHEMSLAIQQGRQAKGWKRDQLAARLSLKSSVIGEYETGKAIPNPGVIRKLEQVLGVKLPRPQKPRPAKKAAPVSRRM
ncbi:hypothetical protein KIPB_011358 [Kipferlia bialata]|uniref:HTH cro/C1-type domain-containing protein n=1 Tax=Kipferlia bialata TaxID=797122 RepID=A0A9K3GN27_9EUKA|nr:hypothetical protein KIPB_011358 [Kipferlia bialata]|eukprot:g11358.t1